MAQPFASSNPPIDALFLREFAQDQADRAAAEAAATRGVQREQIGAQYKLAEAQQQSNAEQQRMNNLFRMADLNQRQQTEAERNRLYARGLDIQEASTKPKTVEQQRKDDITTTNAAAKAAAMKWQDAYNSIVEAQLDKAATPGALNFWGSKENYRAELEKPNNPQRIKIEEDAWNLIAGQMRGDKSGSSQLVIPDFKARKFHPVQYDDKGNLIVPPVIQQPGGTSGSTSAGGTNPATAGTTQTQTNAPEMGNDAALLFKVGEPIVRQGINSFVGMLSPRAPGAVAPDTTSTGAAAAGLNAAPEPYPMIRSSYAQDEAVTALPGEAPVVSRSTPSVRRPLGNDFVLLTPEDDAELSRQLIAIPAAQRPMAYRNIVSQWLLNRRAVPVPAITEPTYDPFKSLREGQLFN